MVIVDYSSLIYFDQSKPYGVIPTVLPVKTIIDHIAKATLDSLVQRELEGLLVKRADRILIGSTVGGGFVEKVRALDYELGSRYIQETLLYYDSFFFNAASRTYTEEEACGFVSAGWVDNHSILYRPPEQNTYSQELSVRLREMLNNPRQ